MRDADVPESRTIVSALEARLDDVTNNVKFCNRYVLIDVTDKCQMTNVKCEMSKR